MKQPDLGKKIAELRKAKGLTQEELVETCNLSVRTLQRIEAGEVMPRSYTLKVIFSALEHPIYDSPESQAYPFGKSGRLISLWLEQFYRYVLDLFNFKTNPMKKITILSITLAAILIGLFALGHESKAQATERARKAIEACDGNVVRWINTGNVDSVLTLYKDDACILPDYCGKESIREMLVFVISQGYKIQEYHTLTINIRDDLAVEKYYCVFQYQGATIKQKGLTEWHRMNGQWLIANDIMTNE
jgi:transcriptional regulator with XRE-family HTH domain